MAENEINTDTILKWIGVVALVAILLVVGGALALFIFSPGLHPGTPAPAVTITPTPTPAPNSYVTDDVTITTMSTSNGWPKVTVQDGREFAVPWQEYDNMLSLGDVVHFTVTGITTGNSGETVYEASSTTVVYHEYDYTYENSNQGFPIIYGPSVVNSDNGYPVYYYDPNTRSAWQWDGSKSDRISIKELRGERVRRGRPPN